jgi:hypothetical protein
MLLHNFYFELMCSFIFYFPNRNRLKFKLHLDSNWFAFIKAFVKGKAFSFSLGHMGQNPPPAPPVSSSPTARAAHFPAHLLGQGSPVQRRTYPAALLLSPST